MTTLRDIGEDRLIERLVALVPQEPGAAAGPGDDCAVVDYGLGHDTLGLLKTDALVAGVHFTAGAAARAVGWKAIARVVSDFAAMGGRAERFLTTVALPPETRVAWVEELYLGMGDGLRACHGVLAGGETSRVPPGSAAVISVAATGSVERGHLVLRSGGRPGDVLFVTGTLGGAGLGKHLAFTPRVDAALWLAAQWKPSAMMDLSDGLARDLPRLAAASNCGYRVDRSALPCTAGCSADEALGDGEDYELLIAMHPGRVPGLQPAWAAAFPHLPLTAVGELAESHATTPLAGGWDHFR